MYTYFIKYMNYIFYIVNLILILDYLDFLYLDIEIIIAIVIINFIFLIDFLWEKIKFIIFREDKFFFFFFSFLFIVFLLLFFLLSYFFFSFSNSYHLMRIADDIFIFNTEIFCLNYRSDVGIQYIINESIISLWLFILWIIYIYVIYLKKNYKYSVINDFKDYLKNDFKNDFIIYLFYFFLISFLIIIIYQEIYLFNINIKFIVSEWNVSFFLQLLIDNYIRFASHININILNIEILNNDYIMEHLTKKDRLFINSLENLQIWFNNYTNKNIILDQDIEIKLNLDFDPMNYKILLIIWLLNKLKWIIKLLFSKDE
jgi:hypothetical protein